MLKIFFVVLLATSIYAGAANARGGGAESMPGTNFTDMPDYRPPPPARCKSKSMCRHLHWRQRGARAS